ncbi:hypothetical protein CSHISOI_08688 [Colletotrichum shisoi]|uniref:GA4 desaturase n=1 Tax=Colletotrichum shisoi TaxID=2078593 RepID=A0A5Q4BIZ5_9PEZI|nr:hypothetical protein CSHISOI_08688 [Colletotrichum shisoi]
MALDKIITSNLSEDSVPASLDSPRQVLGSFNYYNGSGIPVLNDLTIIEGTSPDNKTYQLPVTDLRSLPTPISSYTHEKHGVMTKEYYPSMTALQKKTLGARCAVVRKHSLRDIPDWAPVGMNPGIGFEIESLAPFSIAHSDYTPAGARGHFRAMKEPDWFVENDVADGSTTAAERDEFFRLRRVIIDAEDRAVAEAGIGPEAVRGQRTQPRGGHWDWDGANYNGPRYAFFSIGRAWETVRRDPLAVMDMSRPVSRKVEYAPLTRTYRDRPGCVSFYYSQNALIRPLGWRRRRRRRDSGFEAGAHGDDDDDDDDVTGDGEPAWRYLSEQTPEEVYFLKFYDSEALCLSGRGEGGGGGGGAD